MTVKITLTAPTRTVCKSGNIESGAGILEYLRGIVEYYINTSQLLNAASKMLITITKATNESQWADLTDSDSVIFLILVFCFPFSESSPEHFQRFIVFVFEPDIAVFQV